MNVFEYSKKIGRSLRIIYSPHFPTDKKFIVSLEGCEIKDGCMLYSYHGNGATVMEAIIDYTFIISEKKIVFNAYSDDFRQEYDVPALITADLDKKELKCLN